MVCIPSKWYGFVSLVLILSCNEHNGLDALVQKCVFMAQLPRAPNFCTSVVYKSKQVKPTCSIHCVMCRFKYLVCRY